MNNLALKTERTDIADIMEKVLLTGDLSSLTSEQRIIYYNRVCESVGLNPLTRPFEYIRLNGKLVLYARKDATDQLRDLRQVSIESVDVKLIGDVYVVVAKAKAGDRLDSSTGAVSIKGLSGDMLANAYMKAETKAKRRVTLSICGLGILDETEVETIPGAKTSSQPIVQKQEALVVNNEEPVVASGTGDHGSYIIKVGKKYVGKKLSEVPENDLLNYANWLSKQDNRTPEAEEFLNAVDAYVGGV